ncbi:MAG: hypothetical protein WDZ35_08885 [Crocinitomicaceae bacterium]
MFNFKNHILNLRFLLALFCVGLMLSGFSQLPKAWMGQYAGELSSINIQGEESTYAMELIIEVENDSAYAFTIIYGKDSLKQVRAYTLRQIGENRFMLDENNGIFLNMNLIGDRLFSVFEVEGNFLHLCYRKTKKGIDFELTSSRKAEISGGITHEDGEAIPAVQSYSVLAYQSAHLNRKK